MREFKRDVLEKGCEECARGCGGYGGMKRLWAWTCNIFRPL